VQGPLRSLTLSRLNLLGCRSERRPHELYEQDLPGTSNCPGSGVENGWMRSQVHIRGVRWSKADPVAFAPTLSGGRGIWTVSKVNAKWARARCFPKEAVSLSLPHSVRFQLLPGSSGPFHPRIGARMALNMPGEAAGREQGRESLQHEW